MGSNIRQFQLDFAALTKGLPERSIILFTRKIGLEAYRRIVLKTPVDTGRARGNWDMTIGSPATGASDTIGPLEPKPAGWKSGDVTSGLQAIQSLKPFETIYITNNLPYIRRLEEDSWSQQFTAGMVASTVQELQNLSENEI